jgi:FAD synthase
MQSFTFGKFAVLHNGHKKLFEKLLQYDNSIVFLSAKRLNDNVNLIRKYYPSLDVRVSNNLFDAVKELGSSEIRMIVGTDRANSFKRLLDKYNGIEYNFSKIIVEEVQRGETDISSTMMRQFIKSGDYSSFKQNTFIDEYDCHQVFEDLTRELNGSS